VTVVLALKLFLVPSLIGGITLAGRRWGPGVAGWLSAFPVLAAPILLFLALEQGISFAAAAARGTLLAVLAILVFGISYSWTAVRFPWKFSLVVAFGCYACAVVCLLLWKPSVVVAAPVVLLALVIAGFVFPVLPVGAASGFRSNDLVWRMLAGAALVVFITQFSSRLGPFLSGLLAMFPVMLSVLAVFSHRDSGAASAIRLIQGAVLGYFAFAAFCLVLVLSLPTVGIGTSFGAALVCALVVQLASRRQIKRP
jgi:uncharacterized membrane protein (GlpM family)